MPGWTSGPFGGMHLPEIIADVTIRHPMVSRYQPRASREAGVAAAAGETDKQDRYPAAEGRAVTAFAMETWGRLGHEGEDLLQMLAAEATRHARRNGHIVTAGSFQRVVDGEPLWIVASSEGWPQHSYQQDAAYQAEPIRDGGDLS